jgi:hypothetical protein
MSDEDILSVPPEEQEGDNKEAAGNGENLPATPIVEEDELEDAPELDDEDDDDEPDS